MAHKKRRVIQHQMEEESRALVRRILPREWVIRDYRPDYGIDIAVEIFEPTQASDAIAEATGEWFFAQVKSVKEAAKRRLKVYDRGNVEKALHVESTCRDEYVEMEVISCEIDTSLLLTIQALGSGTPVLLFLLTLDTGSLYDRLLKLGGPRRPLGPPRGSASGRALTWIRTSRRGGTSHSR